MLKPILFPVILFIPAIFPGWMLAAPAGNTHNQPENEIVVALNALAYSIADQHDHFYSFRGIRALTMVHLAIHDVLNTIDPAYERYAYHREQQIADPFAAVSEAARRILKEAFPLRHDTIDQICNQWLRKSREGEAGLSGIDLGKRVADAYLSLRENDGHQAEGDYVPMTKPGDYQHTPGWDGWVLKPDFDRAMPFALDTVVQFRSPPPPALDSRAYTDSYLEVKEYGGKNSQKRSNDQTCYAHWWAEFAEHSWNRIGRIAAEKLNMGLHETARMFALINMDIYDIYLASLESKYFYDTWRPYTAIRHADKDGNEHTAPDADWQPEMLTPPWPEYPSAHAAVAAGGAEIISGVTGTAKMKVTMISTSALPACRVRSISDLNEAAVECAESRIMNGFHFRFATDEGLKQGRRIAGYILSNYLLPLKSSNRSGQ